MPAKSRAQQKLMGAAEHGATFPMAQQIQQSMSLGQMRDFARGPMTGKPEHVKKTRGAPLPARSESRTRNAALPAGHPHGNGHPNRHKNLGKFLHPKKGGK